MTEESRYRTGELPNPGDRVLGRLSGRQAVVESVEVNGESDVPRLVLNYDDNSVPAGVFGKPYMYELVSREAPEYAVGDTVSGGGRRGFAKVIGLGERTKYGQRYRIQWDGVGATEFVYESELTLVRKGEAMFQNETKRLSSVESKADGLAYRMGEAEARLDVVEGNVSAAFENGLATASKVERLDEKIDGVDVVVRSTADRVRKIEAREGSGSAGLNALSSTVGNVDREISKLNDKVERVANTESKRVELALARIQEVRGDLALLAKAQLRAAGFAALDGVDPLEAIQAAYGVSTESKSPQWTWTPKDSWRSVRGSDQSGVASSDVIAGLVDLNRRVSEVDAHFNELDSALYDVDGESLITDLDERLSMLSARFDAYDLKANQGVVYVTRDAVSGTLAELDARVDKLSRDLADLRTHTAPLQYVDDLASTVEEVRGAAAEMLEKHPAVGSRIEALERRFNYVQNRARKLRNGPLSYDKRLASLEAATASLIQNVGPPALGLNNAAERIERLENVERNRERYVEYMASRGKDYESRISSLERDLNRTVSIVAKDVTGRLERLESQTVGAVFTAGAEVASSANARLDALEKTVDGHWEAICTAQRNVSAYVDEIAEKMSLRLETFRKAQLDEIERKIGPWRRATEAISGRITGHDEALNVIRKSLDSKRSENTSTLERVLDEIQTVWVALRGLQGEVNGLQSGAPRSFGSLLVEAFQSDAGRKLVDEMRHKDEDADDDEVEACAPYESWRPCGVPDCAICKVNREYRDNLDRAERGEPIEVEVIGYEEKVEVDGTVFVDVVICEPVAFNPAWECLHKNERHESEHGTYGRDEDGV